MEAKNQLEELVRNLPEDLRAEVYDFVCFLLQRELREETKEWNQFSLRQALGITRAGGGRGALHQR